MTTPMNIASLENTANDYADDITTRLRDGENLRAIMSDFQSLFVTDKHQGVDVFDTVTVIATVTVENTHFWVEVLAIDKSTKESKQRTAYVRK